MHSYSGLVLKYEMVVNFFVCLFVCLLCNFFRFFFCLFVCFVFVGGCWEGDLGDWKSGALQEKHTLQEQISGK